MQMEPKNGKKVTKMEIDNNGKKDRVYKEWYYSDRKKPLEHYKDNLKDGTKTEWYESSGKKKSTSHYKNGIENGFRKEWNETGQLTFQGNYVDGVEEIK